MLRTTLALLLVAGVVSVSAEDSPLVALAKRTNRKASKTPVITNDTIAATKGRISMGGGEGTTTASNTKATSAPAAKAPAAKAAASPAPPTPQAAPAASQTPAAAPVNAAHSSTVRNKIGRASCRERV